MPMNFPDEVAAELLAEMDEDYGNLAGEKFHDADDSGFGLEDSDGSDPDGSDDVGDGDDDGDEEALE
jgi:hypothetical protein